MAAKPGKRTTPDKGTDRRPPRLASRLVRPYAEYEDSCFTDTFAFTAYNVESAFQLAGGRPGKDYTFADVMHATATLLTITNLGEKERNAPSDDEIRQWRKDHKND